MRILYIHAELGMLAGGGENFSRNLIRSLVNRGHEVTVVFTAPRKGIIAVPIPTNVHSEPLYGYWNRKLGQGTLSLVGQFLGSRPIMQIVWRKIQFAAAWRAVSWHNRRFMKRALQHFQTRWKEFDIAYIHSDIQIAAKIAEKLPTFMRLAGPISENELENLRKIHAIVANGDVFHDLQKKFGNTPITICELPIGLDTEHFSPDGKNFRDKLGWNKGEIVLGYAGRMTPLKGVYLLCDAFCMLAKSHRNLRLLLVGTGEELHSIRIKLNQQGFAERYQIVDVQTSASMPEWYRSMDIFIMPSLYENFSNAVLEAMGCGLAIVASQVGGNKMLVSDHKNGRLFTPGSNAELAQILESIIQQKLWSEMGKYSRVKITEENFSWDRTASVFETIVAKAQRH